MTTTRVFLRWKIEQYRNRCIKCNCSKWQHKLNPKFTCQSCQPSSPENKMGFIKLHPDPSNINKQYTLDKKGHKFKWKLENNGTNCHGCYTHQWIPSSVYDSAHHYRCSRCRPVKKNARWKFVKKLSRWVIWSEKKQCGQCNRLIWLSGNTCSRCQKIGMAKKIDCDIV